MPLDDGGLQLTNNPLPSTPTEIGPESALGAEVIRAHFSRPPILLQTSGFDLVPPRIPNLLQAFPSPEFVLLATAVDEIELMANEITTLAMTALPRLRLSLRFINPLLNGRSHQPWVWINASRNWLKCTRNCASHICNHG